MQQRYSKDVVDKGVQKLGEKSKTVVKARKNRYEKQLQDRVIGGNETVRRVERTRAGSVVQKAKPKHDDAVPLVAEGVIKHPKTVEGDLQAELGGSRLRRPRTPTRSGRTRRTWAKVEGLLKNEGVPRESPPRCSTPPGYSPSPRSP
jgi:hypothetical protein